MQHAVFGIWQSRERQLLLLPVLVKGGGTVRAKNEYFCIKFAKIRIRPTQLRHVPAAERSEQAAVKYQHNMVLAPVARKSKRMAIAIIKGKIGGWHTGNKAAHGISPPLIDRIGCTDCTVKEERKTN